MFRKFSKTLSPANCLSRKSSISWKYSKTFPHAKLSQPQVINFPETFKDFFACKIIPAATSNHPAISIPAATSNHPASSIAAATSSHSASSIPAATSNQPATKSSFNTAAVPQRVASTQQRSHKK